MQQPISEHGGSGKQKADGLIAIEETALRFSPGSALLLNSVALQFVIHAWVTKGRNGQYSGGWMVVSRLAPRRIAVGSDRLGVT